MESLYFFNEEAILELIFCARPRAQIIKELTEKLSVQVDISIEDLVSLPVWFPIHTGPFGAKLDSFDVKCDLLLMVGHTVHNRAIENVNKEGKLIVELSVSPGTQTAIRKSLNVPTDNVKAEMLAFMLS